MDESIHKRFSGVAGTCFCLVALAVAGAAEAADHSVKARTLVLMPGLGDVQHPVTSKNAEAQQFFNQGLALIFAFNHDEAIRSFRRAADQCLFAGDAPAAPVGRLISSHSSIDRGQSSLRSRDRDRSASTFPPV
jgi:hypothetical protein